MKVISVPLAKTTWAFDLAAINPEGRNLADVIRAIGQRYGFAKFPQHVLDVNKENALEFNSGAFTRDAISYRVGMTIYNNGIAADSLSSTAISEEFLNDLADWLVANHKLLKPEVKRVAYLNQLVVQARAPLPLWNTKLAWLEEKLTENATDIYGKPRQYRFSALGAWAEGANFNEGPAAFRLERKIPSDISENIYFSQAPMQTQIHTEILEQVETSLIPR